MGGLHDRDHEYPKRGETGDGGPAVHAHMARECLSPEQRARDRGGGQQDPGARAQRFGGLALLRQRPDCLLVRELVPARGFLVDTHAPVSPGPGELAPAPRYAAASPASLRCTSAVFTTC